MRVDEIARLLKAEFEGDGSREIRGIAALDLAGLEDLTFAESESAVARAQTSGAGCILISRGAALPGLTTIAVDHPKLALIRAAEALLPVERPSSGVHPTAAVAPD